MKIVNKEEPEPELLIMGNGVWSMVMYDNDLAFDVYKSGIPKAKEVTVRLSDFEMAARKQKKFYSADPAQLKNKQKRRSAASWHFKV